MVIVLVPLPAGQPALVVQWVVIDQPAVCIHTERHPAPMRALGANPASADYLQSMPFSPTNYAACLRLISFQCQPRGDEASQNTEAMADLMDKFILGSSFSALSKQGLWRRQRRHGAAALLSVSRHSLRRPHWPNWSGAFMTLHFTFIAAVVLINVPGVPDRRASCIGGDFI